MKILMEKFVKNYICLTYFLAVIKLPLLNAIIKGCQ